MNYQDIEAALKTPHADIIGELISTPENQWFDRKSGQIKPSDLARPLIAFANADGGTVALGIHNGTFTGVNPTLENDIRQAAIDYTTPPVRTRIQRHIIDEKILLLIHIDPSDSVHTARNGDCYLRIGDESRKLSLSAQQELMYDRGTQSYEATASQLDVADLDQEQLRVYQETIGSSSVPEMLAARDLIDRKNTLTAAAELLFAKRPQQHFPSAYVRVLSYDNNERGLGDSMNLITDQRFEGSLPQQIDAASAHIEKLIPHRQRLQSNGKFGRVPIIPRDAWIEGLVNAVIHRSYSIMGDHIRVEIFPNRVEISSPGRFPGIVDPASPLSISRYARNPRIARVCADLGITRELGEGIKRIFHEMQTQGLATPIYRQLPSSVILVLNASNAIDPAVINALPKSAQKILSIMRAENRPLGTGHLAELAQVSRPTAARSLQALAKAGLAMREGSSERDPRASWRLL